MSDSERLVAAARGSRLHAIAPHSGFKVGAALLAANGRIVTGCNIENASYGLTMCAERVALFKALSEGCRDFTMIAVVADTEAPVSPCGSCRQLLWEYCGNVSVVMATLSTAADVRPLADLLPMPFDGGLLPRGGGNQ